MRKDVIQNSHKNIAFNDNQRQSIDFVWNRKNKRAQTVTELAIFGSILIFILGAIIRQAMQFGHFQNQNLKAMRMAMKASFEYSEGLKGPHQLDSQGTNSRNGASVLIIEDRLSAASAKFGAVERVPLLSSGSATHSRNLFRPTAAGTINNLPIYDVYVNGKQFPFTTAGFKTVCLMETRAFCDQRFASDGGYDLWIGEVDPGFWQPRCVTLRVLGGPDQDVGCARLYAITPNNPGNTKWCDDDSVNPCPNGWSADQRFDLDRDGISDVPPAERDEFAWQWLRVSAVNIDKFSEYVASVFYLRLNIKEGISFGENNNEQANIILDMDGDLKEERILQNTPDTEDSVVTDSTGVILRLQVIDSQEGDMDFTYNSSDYQSYNDYVENYPGLDSPPPDKANGNVPPPGFSNNVGMYVRVGPGTYLLIEEGKMLSPTRQYVRQTQWKDHIDLIHRPVQLSNNTERFCKDGVPQIDPNIWTAGEVNPVEACNGCFTTANIWRTCFDERYWLLFIRSRVRDSFSRRWITDTSGDDYIPFDVE